MSPNRVFVVCLVIFTGWIWACESVVQAGGSDRVNESLGLLSAERPGRNPIGLRVWTDKEPAERFTTGERITINFHADSRGYLAVVSASSAGNITILFPNRERQDNMIRKGKIYTLFGDDSRLRLILGNKTGDAKLAIYISSTPFKLDPLKAGEGQECVTIAPDASAEIRILKEKLRTMAKGKGFNRVFLSFKGGAGESFEINPVPASRMKGKGKLKRLPTAVESEKPGTVTGVQGVKMKRPE